MPDIPSTRKWWTDYWPFLLNPAGGILLAVVGVLVSVLGLKWDQLPWWIHLMFWPGLILAIAGSWTNLQRTKRLTELERELVALRESVGNLQAGYLGLIDLQLVKIASDLKLEADCRISLYSHTGNAFVRSGRHSRNTRHRRAGRNVYPDDQGCIGKAWEEGVCYSGILPDPVNRKNDYDREMERKWSIPPAVLATLTMKSRQYYARRLDGHVQESPVAVVVVESTSGTKLNIEAIGRFFDGSEGKELGKFLGVLAPIAPNLGYAREQGF